ALGDGVGDLVGDRQDGIDRRHVDDATTRPAVLDLFDHEFRDRLACEEDALEIDPQHAVEIVLLQVEKPGSVNDAGIRYEDIDVAESVEGRRDKIVDVETLADIRLHETGFTELFKVVQRPRTFLAIYLRDHDSRALAHEALGYRIANSTGAAGNDRRPAVERHRLSPCLDVRFRCRAR